MQSSKDNGQFPKVSRRYTRYTVAKLITFLTNVFTLVLADAGFVSLKDAAEALQAAVGDLSDKARTALNRDKMAIGQRNVAHGVTLQAADDLANGVDTVANGRLEVVINSGFDAVRAPSKPEVPEAPSNPRLLHGDVSGALVFAFKAGRNSRNFTIQTAEDADGPWIDRGLCTTRRVTIPGLTPGKIYWARAQANAAAGPSDWSVPTCLMAI